MPKEPLLGARAEDPAAGPRRARSRRPRRRSRRPPGRTRRSAPCRGRRGARRRAGARPTASEKSRKTWFIVSAIEWAASASMADDPVTRPATSLATAIDALAASAMSTVRRAAGCGRRRGTSARAVARGGGLGHERADEAAAARRPRDATGRPARSGGRAPRRPRAARRCDDQPVTSKPSPTRSTAWWWWDFVPWTTSPAARAASEPSLRRTSWSAPSKEPGLRRCSWWPWLSGRCCSRVPPRGDVHDLHAAADAEQREVALERAARERDLEVVALRHRARGSRRGPAPRRSRDRCRRRRPG